MFNFDIAINFHNDSDFYEFAQYVCPWGKPKEEHKLQNLIQSKNGFRECGGYAKAKSFIFDGNIKIRRDMYDALCYFRMNRLGPPTIYRWRNRKLTKISDEVVNRIYHSFYPTVHTTSYVTY